MKILTPPEKSIKSNAEKPVAKEVSRVRDKRDLEDSRTDWNAEQNQSGRHK